ncbi:MULTISPECIES: hypothetical protein [Spirulina sp. CCY15215]|uniref:hypothetical protein n=1 Tax=Spirulina sp. CCY15215 TaxID=2767591 RepID=UPI00194F6E65
MKSNQPRKNVVKEELISLRNCIAFFRQNWRLLLGIVLILSGCTIVFSWSQSKSHGKLYYMDITFSVRWNPILLPRVTHSSNLTIPSPSLEVDEVYQMILNDLRKLFPKEIGFGYSFDTEALTVNSQFSASDPEKLTDIHSVLERHLEKSFQNFIEHDIKEKLSLLEVILERYKNMKPHIDKAILEKSIHTYITNWPSIYHQEKETQMETVIIQNLSIPMIITEMESEKQYLEKLLRNPEEITSKILSIETLRVSPIESNQSPRRVIVLAFIASIAFSIPCVIVYNKIKNLLSISNRTPD